MLSRDVMLAHRDELLELSRERLEEVEGAQHLTENLRNFLDGVLDAVSTDEARESNVALVGRSAAMARVRHGIGQLARRSRAPALLLGEAGSGKRHSAIALHAATYPEGEFFDLDADDRILELNDKLGLMRARVSAPSSAGMTVYVPEVSEASALAQLQISRLLQEQSLQCRVVVGSSRALGPACRDGRLRSDLVFRFATQLELPALRDRPEDIPELVRYFAERSARLRGCSAATFSLGALERLQRHAWPGNLSELVNIVERASLDVTGGTVGASDLSELDSRPSGVFFTLPPTGIDLAELERELLSQALTMARNNQTRAAALLGLTRDQMRYRLGKFGISATDGERRE